MSIKNLAPSEKSIYTQGYFKGARKYFGPEPIIYRSKMEYDFMMKMELNPKVEKWSSEQIIIPYTMLEKQNGKVVKVRHNYNTDFTVILTTGEKYLVEVKPKAFSPKNEKEIHRNPIIYKNACKWKAALAWAKLNNFKFIVINEEHLKTRIF